MAITAYNGPPGAGKSHALVKEVILPAVLAGRRVVSNIDGLNPNAIAAYFLQRPEMWAGKVVTDLGEVVTFHGQDSQLPGFWPTEETEAAKQQTFIRPGDLVVFDEWAMFWPPGDKTPASIEVEKFMRWHRHLTHPETGVATDLAIATQSITDFSRRHRPLLSRSYLFKKLTTVGMANAYTWNAYDGRMQKTPYQTGHGKYDPDVFPLYASSAAAGAGNHGELKTNKRETIWSGWKAKAFIFGLPVLLAVGLYFLHSAWQGMGGDKPLTGSPQAVAAAGGAPVAPGAAAAPAPATSPWRIVGQIEGDDGTRVIVADASGGVRILKPDQFQFDQGQAVSGTVDGKFTVAEDRLPVSGEGGPVFGGMMQ